MQHCQSIVIIPTSTSEDYDQTPNGVLFRDIKAFLALQLFRPKEFIAQDFITRLRMPWGSKMDTDPQAVWPGSAPTFAQDLVASDIAAHV